MKKIELNKRVDVYGTGKVKTFPKGEKFSVHAELATKLIKDGKATGKK
jgi:hypothetical protein